ncbi:MAG: TonB-dependent receptor [Alphaproteobacteria bacterium]
MSSRARIVSAGVAALLSLHSAGASEPAVRQFNIAPQAPKQSLIDFALQAGVTISTEGARNCGDRTSAVIGEMAPARALKKLLAGTPCRFNQVDANTFRLIVDATEPDNVTAEEIVVTATRRSLRIDKAPYSISTIGGEALSESRSESVLDIASRVAGLTVTNIGPGRDKILLRGLSDGTFSGRTQSMVGLYLDNTPLTYNAPDPDLRLTDIDRVEVLRGPQGTLYGANTLGGIVHLITNKPDTTGIRAALDATGSGTTGGGASSSFDGMINIPIVRDKLAVRVVGYHEADGGYIDDERLGLSNVNNVTRSGERYSALWKIDDRWTLTAGGAAQSISAGDSQYAQSDLAPLHRANNLREPHTNDFHESNAALDGLIWGNRLTISATYVNHELENRYDASDAAPLYGLPPQALAYDEAIGNEAVAVDALLQSTGTRRLQWLVGAMFSHADETYFSALRAPSDPSAFYQEHRVDHVIEAALYGEAIYRLNSTWSLTAGLRASRLRLHTRSLVDPTMMSTRSFRGDTTFTNVVPKVVISDEIASDLLIYGQAAEGYRPDGFNSAGPEGQQFSTTGTGPQPDRRFMSDKLWNYEIGMKLALAGDAMHLRTAAFYSTWLNIQTDQFLRSGLPFTANVGDGENKGLEIELVWTISPNITIETNGLINDPEITARNPNAPAQNDAGLPGVPRVSAGGSFHYQREIAHDVTMTANIDYAYVGPSQLTFVVNSSTKMGGYSTGAISVGLIHANARLSLFVDNPFNGRGNTFAFGNPFALERDTTPLRPRTFGARISWAFR